MAGRKTAAACCPLLIARVLCAQRKEKRNFLVKKLGSGNQWKLKSPEAAK